MTVMPFERPNSQITDGDGEDVHRGGGSLEVGAAQKHGNLSVQNRPEIGLILSENLLTCSR